MGIKIAIAGEMRSGKDTVADMLMDVKGIKFYPLRFAEGIEYILNDYFPEAFEEGKKPRYYFQKVGQLMREVNPAVWINFLNNRMESAKLYGESNFIVTDLRQPNEYEWLKENGFIVIKVETSKEVRLRRMKEANDDFQMEDINHETEINVRNLSCDYLIQNNGTLGELKGSVGKVFINIIMGGK